MVRIQYADLEGASEFANMNPDGENEAFLALDTGAFHLRSMITGDLDEELPDDLDESDRYVLVPSRRSLDLGRRLALEFVAERLPAELEQARRWFQRPGAYARLRDRLEEHGLLAAWEEYDAAALERELRAWAAEHGIEVVGGRGTSSNRTEQA
ncbi:MAG: hypothetical protein HZA53_12115 [Planctomycetes bacterium]|nr:hypothetical protein [Planctomycetota bacterium]